MANGSRPLLVSLSLALFLAEASAAEPPRTAPARPVHVDQVPKSLSGEWEFALGDPATGVDGLDTLQFRRLQVPGTWQEGGVAGHGVAWYRLRLELDPAVVSIPLAFTTERIKDADEVYLDGQLVGRTGSFPPRYDKGTLVARVYELPATLTSRPGTHVLSVRVFNPGPGGGGIVGEPLLDSVSAAVWKRTQREAPSLILAAAIAALGVFSLFIFLREREQWDLLYFSFYTTGFAVYLVTRLSAWAETSVPLSLLYRVSSAGSFALFGLFVLFLYRFFDRPFGRLLGAALALQVPAVLACLFWPRVDDIIALRWLLYVTVPIAIVEVFRALLHDARRHVPYARPVLFGILPIAAAVVFDVGVGARLWGHDVGTFRLLGPAFLLFTLVFLTVVADRIARMREAASTDPLTGLANRSVLFERLSLELSRARRSGHSVTLGILDLDHFKKFNDKYGHVAGDRLLVAASRTLKDSVRDTDLAARYGGEEFVVLLPESNALDSVSCLERIRRNVACVRISSADPVTVSIGVAVFDPEVAPNVSVTALFRQADSALYKAKAEGRDRIVIAEGAPPVGSSSGNFRLDRERRRTDPDGHPAASGRRRAM